MMYQLRRRRHLGVAIDRAEFAKAAPLRADVHITECHSPEFGRLTITAWVFNTSPHQPEAVPRLLDVKIISMAQNGMVLSGIEQVDGAFYAQSWLCQLE